ncbi:MAG: 2'-5' RNA ligase family protein [Burkholderiales bacterium]|nr:2'-5' RNA ligase family protein [Burkholderiales bacterium]
MFDQMSFFEGDPPSGEPPAKIEPWDPKQGAAKLFLGLRPTSARALEMWRISNSLDLAHGIRGNLRNADLLHITLLELGDYLILPKQEVIDVRQLVEAVVSPTFDLALNRAMTFKGNGAYALLVGEGLEQIKALRQRLGIAVKRAGRPVKSGFNPHMTLSYNGCRVDEHLIEPIRWHVDEFVLINSHSGESHHEVVGSWPLRP